MKQFYLKTLVLLLMSIVGVNSFAYDCVVDGIYYNLNNEEMTAEVVSNPNKYSGDIVIPSEITFSGPMLPTSNRAATANSSGEMTYRVTSIGSGAFSGCSGLTSVTIPNSVTTIGGNAFSGCKGLTNIIIPNSITSIEYNAFEGCTGLTRVDYTSLEHLCSIVFGAYNSNPLIYAKRLYINGEELKDNLVLPESITVLHKNTFRGLILKNVLLKHLTPPTIKDEFFETFSNHTFYHAVLYVPNGAWESYAYDDAWYKFINIREVATETDELSSAHAYTLMDAQKFTYQVYDPVNNGISTITSTGIDENNPNHCWQTLTVEGQHYLYNIGARRFAVSSADGLVLTDKARSLSVTDGKDGLLFDNQTDRQWAMVVNDKMTVDTHAEEAVTTAVALMKADPSQPVSTCYGVDGRRQSTSQRGLNILRMSDGTVRKVMVK